MKKRTDITNYDSFICEGKEPKEMIFQRIAYGNIQQIADQYEIKLSTGDQLILDLEKVAYTSFVLPAGDSFKPDRDTIMQLQPWNGLIAKVTKLLDQVGNLEIFTNPELYKLWCESSYVYTSDPKIVSYMRKVRKLAGDLQELCTSSSTVQSILHDSLGYDNRSDEFNKDEIEYALSKT